MDSKPCTYRVSVKAIIKDSDGRVLLLQEADGQWDLPGGGLEHNESVQDGLAREVLEETGYRVTSVSEQPVAFWTINRPEFSVLQWFAFVAYEVSVTGKYAPAQDTNDAAVAAKYVSGQEALQLKLPNARDYFELYFR